MNQQQANKTNNISDNQTDKSTKRKHMKNLDLDIYEIYVINLVLQKITKKPSNVVNQKIRKNSKWKKGNIAIVTFST